MKTDNIKLKKEAFYCVVKLVLHLRLELSEENIYSKKDM